MPYTNERENSENRTQELATATGARLLPPGDMRCHSTGHSLEPPVTPSLASSPSIS